MFRTVPLSIIRSFSLYTQQWYMLQFCRQLASTIRTELVSPVPSWSCSHAVCKTVWHIPLLSVQWKTPDYGQRNCPKHIEFHSKNKFEKLVHLVGFITRNLSRCPVTWTSSKCPPYSTIFSCTCSLLFESSALPILWQTVCPLFTIFRLQLLPVYLPASDRFVFDRNHWTGICISKCL